MSYFLSNEQQFYIWVDLVEIRLTVQSVSFSVDFSLSFSLLHMLNVRCYDSFSCDMAQLTTIMRELCLAMSRRPLLCRKPVLLDVPYLKRSSWFCRLHCFVALEYFEILYYYYYQLLLLYTLHGLGLSPYWRANMHYLVTAQLFFLIYNNIINIHLPPPMGRQTCRG